MDGTRLIEAEAAGSQYAMVLLLERISESRAKRVEQIGWHLEDISH
jgi:hypothetical protein